MINSKVLFLDIDGVANCATTHARFRGFIGIDPYMAFMIGKIVLDTDCKLVLSSSWRCFHDDGVLEISKQISFIDDVTPSPWYDKERQHTSTRGEEIQAWLDVHPEVTTYAIVDDDSSMLETQLPNYFQTRWSTGITPQIAEAITEHLRRVVTV